jgi:hypothetical protein
MAEEHRSHVEHILKQALHFQEGNSLGMNRNDEEERVGLWTYNHDRNRAKSETAGAVDNLGDPAEAE